MDQPERNAYKEPAVVTVTAVVVLDGHGRVAALSPQAEELLGRRAQELTGRPFSDVAAPERGGQLTGRTAREGPVVLGVTRQDGRRIRVMASCFLASGPPGGLTTLVLCGEVDDVACWEAQQAMLRRLVSQSPVGLNIYGPDLRLLWANARSGAELDASGNRPPVGRHADELFSAGAVLSDGYPPRLQEVLRGVLRSGRPVIDLHYRGLLREPHRQERIWSCSYYRLETEQGQVLGLCEESVDITDRYRAERRLSLLAEAGRRLGASLDVLAAARGLALATALSFADAVAVDVFASVLDGEVPPTGAALGGDRLLRVVEESGPAGRPSGRRGPGPEGEPEPVAYPPASAQARSLASGRSVVSRIGAAGPGGADGDGHHVVAPLSLGDHRLGLVTFERLALSAPFGVADREVIDELAARTAICLDNARRFTREHRAAVTLQRSLLPKELVPHSTVEIGARYLPADDRIGVGGDWYDAIPLSSCRIGLVVGDIVGHGIDAAVTMARARTTVRALARLDLPPDELLARMDDVIIQSVADTDGTDADGTGPATGATCLYVVYDPLTGTCTAASAGHLGPAVLPADGTDVRLPDLPVGPPLGVGGLPFVSTEFSLPGGSLVALFTDGLVKGVDLDVDRGRQQLGETLVAHRGAPVQELCDALAGVLPAGRPPDDAAVLVARTHRLPPDHVAAWEVPTDPTAVAQARRLVRSQLEAWELQDLEVPTELIVSELATNAIRYAPGGTVNVRLIRDERLVTEVSDSGYTSPHMRRAAVDDEGGRGLFLVAQMSGRWGTRYTAGGKTIWAEQELPVAAGG